MSEALVIVGVFFAVLVLFPLVMIVGPEVPGWLSERRQRKDDAARCIAATDDTGYGCDGRCKALKDPMCIGQMCRKHCRELCGERCT